MFREVGSLYHLARPVNSLKQQRILTGKLHASVRVTLNFIAVPFVQSSVLSDASRRSPKKQLGGCSNSSFQVLYGLIILLTRIDQIDETLCTSLPVPSGIVTSKFEVFSCPP
jgi:hypothetical protein